MKNVSNCDIVPIIVPLLCCRFAHASWTIPQVVLGVVSILDSQVLNASGALENQTRVDSFIELRKSCPVSDITEQA